MDPSSSPDYRKSLHVLNEEWSDCTRCSLGERRDEVGSSIIRGEGVTGGVMFIGKGPSREDELAGGPFTDKPKLPGRVLRHVIKKLNIPRVYITNVVSCRSCAPDYDNEGQPVYRKDFKTGILKLQIKDQAPTPGQVKACLARLHEEIYLVDPDIIIALGGAAAEALTRRSVSIQSENGTTVTIRVPGAGRRPSITEKRQVWARKVKGALVLPSVRAEVEYLMVPLLDPAYIISKGVDARMGNPVQVFIEGMLNAMRAYDRYLFETRGDMPTPRQLSEDDVQEAIDDE